MRQETRTLYFFNELSEDAKKKAIEKLRDINVDHQWWNFIYDDVQKILGFLGFQDITIEFSGFYSQGDGASFTGRYSFNKEWRKALEEYDPLDHNDSGWKKFGEALEAASKIVEASTGEGHIEAEITRSDHHYSHENTVSFNVYSSEDMYADIPEEAGEAFVDTCQNIMRHIYGKLEGSYDNLTGDEAVAECIIANEYEFTEKGEMV